MTQEELDQLGSQDYRVQLDHPEKEVNPVFQERRVVLVLLVLVVKEVLLGLKAKKEVRVDLAQRDLMGVLEKPVHLEHLVHLVQMVQQEDLEALGQLGQLGEMGQGGKEENQVSQESQEILEPQESLEEMEREVIEEKKGPKVLPVLLVHLDNQVNVVQMVHQACQVCQGHLVHLVQEESRELLEMTVHREIEVFLDCLVWQEVEAHPEKEDTRVVQERTVHLDSLAELEREAQLVLLALQGHLDQLELRACRAFLGHLDPLENAVKEVMLEQQEHRELLEDLDLWVHLETVVPKERRVFWEKRVMLDGLVYQAHQVEGAFRVILVPRGFLDRQEMVEPGVNQVTLDLLDYLEKKDFLEDWDLEVQKDRVAPLDDRDLLGLLDHLVMGTATHQPMDPQTGLGISIDRKDRILFWEMIQMSPLQKKVKLKRPRNHCKWQDN